jgi:hypothetical protein
MRARRRRACRDVNREGGLVGSLLVEELRHAPDELLLGSAAEPLLGQPLVGAVRDLRRPPDRVELAGLLDGPQGFDEAATRHRVHAADRLKQLEVRVGQRVRLEAHPSG